MNKQLQELLIATSNQGKLTEIKSALGDLPLELRLLQNYSPIAPPDENGTSYEENAILKAAAYAGHTGCWALADDSGLEVEYLQGAPGLKSARFGGPSDSDRVDLLLSKLTEAGAHQREARFVCVVAIVDSEATVLNIARGECTGTIAQAPAGNGGFGYDPIFIPQGYASSFGELPIEVKDRTSHRALALAATRAFLMSFLDGNLTASEAGS